MMKGCRGSKYHAHPVDWHGEHFDSKKEFERYAALSLLERDGNIQNLRRQVKYVLIPAQREPDTKGPRGGTVKGKLLERECSYKADFVYDMGGETIVEDVKGVRTEAYRIKKKLMLERYGIRIKET
jgi:hypothetical protein